MALQRQGHRPVHTALGERMRRMVQLLHRRIDDVAILALYGPPKLSDC
jgi:hypothetical protein